VKSRFAVSRWAFVTLVRHNVSSSLLPFFRVRNSDSASRILVAFHGVFVFEFRPGAVEGVNVIGASGADGRVP
jgi:hypothetical protein